MSFLGRIRHHVKRALEIGIVRSGIVDRMGLHPKRSRLVLAYHNVVADDDPLWGERVLHIRRGLFERHVDLLQEKGRILPLLELLEDSDRRVSEGPRFALTFDDAYQGALEAIESVLAPRGIPCTVFVNPGLLGSRAFWWDQVAEVFGGRIPLPLREEFLFSLGGEWSKVSGRASSTSGALPSPPQRRFQPPTHEHLRHLLSLPSPVELASHTWSHFNLSALPVAGVLDQVERSQVWLEDFGVPRSPVLAYPYGFPPVQLQTELGSLGIRYGLLVEGGHLPEPQKSADPLLLPRVAIPSGLSPEGLKIRIAGLR